MYVIRIHEFASKDPDSKTLKEYYGTDFIFFQHVEYNTFRGEVGLTPYVEVAKKFKSPLEAMIKYKEIHPNFPQRPDGKPNRPLTAFNVEVVALEKVMNTLSEYYFGQEQ